MSDVKDGCATDQLNRILFDNVPRSMATTLVTPSAMAPSVLDSSVIAK